MLFLFIFNVTGDIRLFFPSRSRRRTKDAGEIKIGVVAMLSGDRADYGVSIKQGLETARDRINGAGGINGKKISLIIEDSRGDKDQAVKAVQKLINEDQVLAIIGPTNSGEMFAVGPIANDAGVVIMGTSNTVEGIGEIGPYVFRNSLSRGKRDPRHGA